MEYICPYCRAPIEKGEVLECPSCHVPHHLECWLENKGCSVPGCSQAPDDESKIVVPSGAVHGAQARQVGGFAVPPVAYRTIPPPIPVHTRPKSRIAFTLLGAILGPLGLHNFYAGYAGKGTAQLLISILTCGWGAIVTWPWAIVEICVVNRDSENALMD
jgi:hypothetical protein